VVMATGIVAIAAQLQGMRAVAEILGWLNALFFAALCILTTAWALRYRRGFLREAENFGTGPGFFTIVAGTAILGGEMIDIFGHPFAAAILWFIALPLWACCMYAIFLEFTLDKRKPALEDGING